MTFQEHYKSSTNFITKYRRFHCCCGRRLKCSESISAMINLLEDNIIKEPIEYKDYNINYKWRRINNTKENMNYIYRLPFCYINEKLIYVLLCSDNCPNFRTIIDNFNKHHMIIKVDKNAYNNPLYS